MWLATAPCLRAHHSCQGRLLFAQLTKEDLSSIPWVRSQQCSTIPKLRFTEGFTSHRLHMYSDWTCVTQTHPLIQDEAVGEHSLVGRLPGKLPRR